MEKILVIAAHPDDELLSLGGTIRKYVEKGYEVNCLILGEGQTSRQDVRTESLELISELHADSLRAAKIIGFKNVHFSNLPDNRFDSVDLLDVIKIVEKYISRYQPTTVFTHHFGDRSIDHRITYDAVMTSVRPVGTYCVSKVYTFDTPSSTEWAFSGQDKIFYPNVFVDITETINYKLDAMDCYKSELGTYPHPRSRKALSTIAARYGIVVGVEYAEAFHLVMSIE